MTVNTYNTSMCVTHLFIFLCEQLVSYVQLQVHLIVIVELCGGDDKVRLCE